MRVYDEVKTFLYAHEGAYIGMGFKDSQLQGIIIQFHLGREQTFAAVTPVVLWLLDHGWVQHEQTEDAEWGYRQIAFKQNDALKLTLRIWPHRDSVRCKKVETGEMKPVYKFECEEGGGLVH